MAQTSDFFTIDFELLGEKITPIFLRDADVLIDTLIGDFAVFDTQSQDVDFILMAKKGQFYWEPLIGYDAQRLQNGRIDIVKETSSLIEELNKDGLSNISDLLIGHTSDSLFVDNIRPEDRYLLPSDSLVINVNATR
jgi:hypothetical protein